MTGPTAAPDVAGAIARGHRAAMWRGWRRVGVAAVLSGALLAGSLTLRDAAAAPVNPPDTAASPTATPATDPTATTIPTTVETTTSPAGTEPPGTPRDMQVAYDDPNKPTEIVVSWSTPTDGGPVARYTVYQDDHEFTPSPGAFEYRIPNDGRVHTYAVAAIGPTGQQNRSPSRVFPAAPAAPVITSAEAVERPGRAWDITIGWDQPDGGGPVTGYTVLNGDQETTTAGSARDTALTADQPGQLQIVAHGPGGSTPSEPVWPKLIPLKPPRDSTTPSPAPPDNTGPLDPDEPGGSSPPTTSTPTVPPDVPANVDAPNEVSPG